MNNNKDAPEAHVNPSPEGYSFASDIWIQLAITVCGALMLLPRTIWGLPGGKSICGALRVLEGQVPYRDFWTMYAPGQFYAIAALFKIFGRECLVQGIAVVLINGLNGSMMFMIARRLGISRRLATVISLIIVMSLWLYSSELTTYPPTLLCVLIAVNLVLCYLQKGGPGKLICTGLFLGIAACFKHDVAFYITTAIIVMLFTGWYGIANRRPTVWSHPIRAAFALIGGAVVIVVPVIVLLAMSAGSYALQDLVIWPATDFRDVRAEGMPTLPNLGAIKIWAANWRDLRLARDAVFGQSHWILCNIPLYVFIVATGCICFVWRRMTPVRLAASILLLVILPLFWTIAHVQPNTHLYTMPVASLCLIAMAWSKLTVALSKQKILKMVLGAVIALYTLGLMGFPATNIARIVLDWSGRHYLGLPGAHGKWVPEYQYDVYHPIVTFIRENVPAEERIYVGLKRHDSPVINDLKFYYLTGRKNCSRYDELHPGITDRADVQQEIIAAIEQHKVRCVVLWHFGWSDHILDELKAHNMAAIPDSGNTDLDTFIAETFEPLASYGEYVLMWRKGIPKPEVTAPENG